MGHLRVVVIKTPSSGRDCKRHAERNGASNCLILVKLRAALTPPGNANTTPGCQFDSPARRSRTLSSIEYNGSGRTGRSA
jgi:hypothetical protein